MGREVIFLDDEDRHQFLDVLSELVHDFNWAVHAYCLMDNHFRRHERLAGGVILASEGVELRRFYFKKVLTQLVYKTTFLKWFYML